MPKVNEPKRTSVLGPVLLAGVLGVILGALLETPAQRRAVAEPSSPDAGVQQILGTHAAAHVVKTMHIVTARAEAYHVTCFASAMDGEVTELSAPFCIPDAALKTSGVNFDYGTPDVIDNSTPPAPARKGKL